MDAWIFVVFVKWPEKLLRIDTQTCRQQGFSQQSLACDNTKTKTLNNDLDRKKTYKARCHIRSLQQKPSIRGIFIDFKIEEWIIWSSLTIGLTTKGLIASWVLPPASHVRIEKSPRKRIYITSGTNLTIMFNLLFFFEDFPSHGWWFLLVFSSPSCRNVAQSSLLAGRLRHVASGMHAWQIGKLPGCSSSLRKRKKVPKLQVSTYRWPTTRYDQT